MSEKKRSHKKKQPDLPAMEGPGVAHKTIKAIETAAEAYVVARDKRMARTELEVDAKTELMKVMKDHKDELGTNKDGETFYTYDEKQVVLRPKGETVKVRSLEQAHDVDIDDD